MLQIDHSIIRRGVFAVVLGTFFMSAPCADAAFDHRYAEWAEILNRFTENGQVDYAGLQQSPEIFNRFLDTLSSVSKSQYDTWPDSAKQAFWLNAYNALAVKWIVDHYPLKRGFGVKGLAYPSNSIQQIPDVWKRSVAVLLGRQVSLNDIEHGTLRKMFREPRIHFALVCASTGCPVLRSEPYVPERLGEQLDDQVRFFLGDRDKARYDSDEDVFYLSPIFKWFREDFEAAGGVASFVSEYFPAEALQKDPGGPSFVRTRIKWLPYDWSLNEMKE